MTSREARGPERVLPPRGSGEVELRAGAPAGQRPDTEPPDIGFLFNSNTRQLVGVYGINPTEDHIWFSVEVAEGARPVRVDLPPGTSVKQRVTFDTPARTRTITRRVTERRPVAEEAEVLPLHRLVVERQFTNPSRNSPVVLSVTRTAVATGTSHQLAMPSTVDAGDLLANVMTWNGDGDNTSNGVPTGWAEDGEVDDAPFGYIALLVKDAAGDEDGTNVNFTTNSGAPVIGHVFRIEAGTWDDSGSAADAVQIGGAANGDSTSPNPGTLTPGWGSADNLWIAVAQSTGDVAFSAVPSGYTDAGQDGIDDSDGELALNTAYRTNEASSENPGAFTMEDFFWLAATIAVKPSAGGTPATVTPSAVAITAAAPSPSATGAAAVSPSDVAAAVAVPQPGILAGALVTPAAVDGVTAVPQPTIDVAPFATPDAVDIAATVPQPTVTAASVVTPLTVEAVAALPQPTVAVAAGAVATVVGIAADVPTPAIAAAALVEPAAVAITADVPAPTAAIAAVATPTVVAIVTTIPQPDLTYSATVTPQVVAINAAVPSGTIFSDVLEIIARVYGQFQRRGSDRLHLARIGRSGRRGFRVVDENWERVSDPFVYDELSGADGDQEATMNAVSSAWAAHAGSDAATLTTAIHTALDGLGYRRPDGTRLI